MLGLAHTLSVSEAGPLGLGLIYQTLPPELYQLLLRVDDDYVASLLGSLTTLPPCSRLHMISSQYFILYILIFLGN